MQVAMLLHNFIVDCRESRKDVNEKYDEEYFGNFDIDMEDWTQTELTRLTGEMPIAVVTDNNEPRAKGRPTLTEMENMELGAKVRHSIMLKLATNNLKRPLQSDMHYNKYGNIYMS